LLPLSPGPVLPQFPERAASVSNTQNGHDIDEATGLRAETALQMGRQVEERADTKGCPGSGSGVCGGREIDRAALVRVQPTVGAPTAPSMSDQPSESSTSAFHPTGGSGAPPSGGSSSTGVTVDVSSSGGAASGVAENGLRRSLLGLSVKLDKYDGTTCLDTFLASVRNFATYYQWYEEDKLFCLRANLMGAAGQVLWDLSTQVTLDDLVRLLRKRFGASDQAERFRTELRTCRRRPNETLQSLSLNVLGVSGTYF